MSVRVMRDGSNSGKKSVSISLSQSSSRAIDADDSFVVVIFQPASGFRRGQSSFLTDLSRSLEFYFSTTPEAVYPKGAIVGGTYSEAEMIAFGK